MNVSLGDKIFEPKMMPDFNIGYHMPDSLPLDSIQTIKGPPQGTQSRLISDSLLMRI
jgi:hypothetical protein